MHACVSDWCVCGGVGESDRCGDSWTLYFNVIFLWLLPNHTYFSSTVLRALLCLKEANVRPPCEVSPWFLAQSQTTSTE